MPDATGTEVRLTSPLTGWASSLMEVPDGVFAQRILGDGVAIEPLGTTLHAPCDGVVASVHASGHAVAMRSPEGAEILLHIGIDTVGQNGRGFHPRVMAGDMVSRGDPLIDFDLDALLPNVPAMVTPMLITNIDAFTILRRTVDAAIDVGDEVMILAAANSAMSPQPGSAVVGETAMATVRVPLAHGIHARPAARIAACAGLFVADVTIARQGRTASALSPVALLALGIARGDSIEVTASGPDAAAALQSIRDLIESGMGENVASVTATPAMAPAVDAPVPVAATGPDGLIRGVAAAPGRAVGTARWLRAADRSVVEHAVDPASEPDRLDRAIAEAGRRLDAIGGVADTILAAHRAILGDPMLRADAAAAMAEGRSADWAWRAALRRQADALRELKDARLAERADDLLDVERQVLATLAGEGARDELGFAPDTILLADDLLPSQLARIGAGGIAGFCTVRGGPTSHVAILAAGLSIPGVVATGAVLEHVAEGAIVILDADEATLDSAPTDAVLGEARAIIAAARERRSAAIARAVEPAVTGDGVAVDVFANLGSQEDAVRAIVNGAEGSGLLRTEFLFLDRPDAPDEDEQAAAYQRIADALEGRPLVVRLLDIGGDKPAPYLPLPDEENPALGLRGIRVGFAYPELLATQLRAILRVRPFGQCRIMVPMVASPGELAAVRDALEEARVVLGVADRIELGAMIETPAAAMLADTIAADADFLSIGTNDLTQYVLAMDRGNPAVAAGVDALHPAVLRMIERTVAGAASMGRQVSVCGGLASDPLGVPILLGLGVTRLSVAPGVVADVKGAIRAVSVGECRVLAQAALASTSATDVRALVRRHLEEREFDA